MRQIRCNNCGNVINIPDAGDNTPDYNISSQLGKAMSSFSGAIPHIIIGKQSQPNINPQQSQNLPNLNAQNVNSPNSRIQPDKFDKIKEYALYFCIALIVSYAGYRLLSGFFGG